MRTSKFDRIIEELESLERVDEKFEYNKSQAISYLKNCADRLDELGIKSIKKRSCRTNPINNTERGERQ